MRMKFMITKTVCRRPMMRDMTEARTAWSSTQPAKTPHTVAFVGVYAPSPV